MGIESTIAPSAKPPAAARPAARSSAGQPPAVSSVEARPATARMPGKARKAQIIEATLRLVAEHGLAGASMSRIAEAVGISNAALYRHFASREDILIAAHDSLMDRVFAWLNSSHELGVIDRLQELGRTHAQLFSMDIEGFNAPMFQFISWLPKDRIREHVVQKRREMLRWYADLVEEGKAQGSVRRDIDTDLVVAELFAWIWWEDLSYLEGLDTQATLNGSANMFARLLARIDGRADAHRLEG